MSAGMRVNLEEFARDGKIPSKNSKGFTVQVNGKSREIDEWNPTGYDLLAKDKSLTEEQPLLIAVMANGSIREINDLMEKIDLTEPGLVRFITKSSEAHYFYMDGESLHWDGNHVTGLQLKKLINVDPENYDLYRELPGDGIDEKIEDDQSIILSGDESDRFYTIVTRTTAGEILNGNLLPSKDLMFLTGKNIPFHLMEEACSHIGLVFESIKLPEKKYDQASTNCLVLLPPGYPDVSPDMFYCHPWLKMQNSGQFPHCADSELVFHGIPWQRWSRHSNEWQAGKDGIWTMFGRIKQALRET